MRRLLLIALLLPSVAQARPWRSVLAPGDLAADHASIEAKCESCHLVYKGVPDDRCLVCHVGIETRIRKRQGFHAAVAQQACISCHGDHGGRDGRLTKAEATQAFDHDKTMFPLRGGHAKPACAKCHDKPLEAVSSACASCHADPHVGRLGPRCQACHVGDAPTWTEGLKTLAQHKVGTQGGHAKLGCNDCHAGGRHLEDKVSCRGCHEVAHGGTKAACDVCHKVEGWKPATFDHDACTCKFPGKHITFSCTGCHANWKFADTPTRCSGCHLDDLTHEKNGECSLCHSALSWKRRTVFDHNKRSKFALTGDHLDVDCTQCHPVAGKWKGTPTACQGCHAEQGKEAHGDFGDCAKCHDTSGFHRNTFDHARTGFALVGRHTKVACQTCHAEKVKGYPKPRTSFFFGASAVLVSAHTTHAAQPAAAQLAQATQAPSRGAACAHCHADPHPGGAGGECSTCHTEEAWTPSTFGVDRHAQTRFPLRHTHATLGCNACHLSLQLGRVPLDCGSCHFDVHQQRLGNNCAGCHNDKGWSDVANFDHARTGFVLSGVHDGVACANCHQGARGAALDRAQSPVDCQTCHTPGHSADLGLDCARCHATALVDGRKVPFAEGRSGLGAFNHRSTGFPLERRHLALACKSCHAAGTSGPGSRCVDCHTDPHAGQLGPSCEECHRPDRFRLARFDHDRAGWPLRGRHFVTACMKCHANQRWVGLTTECWDCHALDAARAQAVAPGIHAFGPDVIDCRSCHRSLWSWRI